MNPKQNTGRIYGVRIGARRAVPALVAPVHQEMA
jgi:hypothetical protein